MHQAASVDQAAGTPAGGRFVTTAKPEPGTTLGPTPSAFDADVATRLRERAHAAAAFERVSARVAREDRSRAAGSRLMPGPRQ